MTDLIKRKENALKAYKEAKKAYLENMTSENWKAFCNAKIACMRLGVIIQQERKAFPGVRFPGFTLPHKRTIKNGMWYFMMTLEQAKEYTREMLEPYYTKEEIEKTVNSYISVVRPGVVLAESNAGKIKIFL